MLAAGGAHEAISGSDDLDDRSALTLLGQASASLARGIEHDAVLRDLRVRLDDLSVQLTDLAADIQGYVQNLDADPARVEQVQQRRAALNTLLRKYGRSVDEVLAWSAQAAQESNDLASSDERIEDLTLRSKALENELAEAARELSSQRSKAAVKLGKEVSAELAHLAMGSAKVSVQVTAKPGSTAPAVSTTSRSNSPRTRAQSHARCPRRHPVVSFRGSCWRSRS